MNAGGIRLVRRIAGISVAAILSSMQVFAEEKDAKTEDKDVPFLKIGPGDYRNFLKSWDEKKTPALCALIRSPEQYDAIFHPVPIRNDNRPAAPPESLYEKEQLLVVARYMSHAPDLSKTRIFDSVWLSEKGDDLELHYRYKAPKSTTSYKTKNHLTVRIPRRVYRKVTIFENDKIIGELKPKDGVWAVPQMGPPLPKE